MIISLLSLCLVVLPLLAVLPRESSRDYSSMDTDRGALPGARVGWNRARVWTSYPAASV